MQKRGYVKTTMDRGKKLETACQKYFKDNDMWLLRLYDTRSAGTYIPSQPSDYIIIKRKGSEFLECKEMDGTLLSISDFRPSQLKAMKRARELNVKYNIIVLVNKRHYYLLDSSEILDTIMMGKKSIQLKDMVSSYKIDDLFVKPKGLNTETN